MSTFDQQIVGDCPYLPERARALPAFKQEKRIQEAVSAGPERRALIWMAEHMPARINSDHLTILGAAGQLFAGAAYAAARWNRWWLLAACFFIFVNWLGDSLDGTLARVRQCQRPRYGFYVDHVLDTFGALFLMGGLALSGFIHPAVAIGMLVAFLMLSVETYLATYTLGKFQLSNFGFGPTEIRILLVIGSVRLIFSPWAHLAGHKFLLFDVGGVIAIGGMLAMMVYLAVRHTIQLYREEPLP